VNPLVDLAALLVQIFATMNNALPATFSALLGEYQHKCHWRFMHNKGRKTNWGNGQKHARHKRLYLYDQIEHEAQAMGSGNGPYRNNTALQVQLDAAAVVLEQKYKNKKCRNAEMSTDAMAPVTVAPQRADRVDHHVINMEELKASLGGRNGRVESVVIADVVVADIVVVDAFRNMGL
jgi:hypothetical protein